MVKLESQITDLNKLETDTDKAVESSTWLPIQMMCIPVKWFTASRLNHCRFYIMGEHFSRYLLYLAETKQRGEVITEQMYQKLFNLFLSMFGLLGNPVPPPENMQIRLKNVVSVPDVTISHAEKILALIKESCVDDIEPPKKTHKTCAEKTERHITDYLDEHIIGQIGGDLLVHLKATASSENKVLGIIVQETYVTFTYLEKREKSENKDEHYIMKFSEPYNYLNPKEREDLMEPLILLSLLQNNPKFLLL
ncbi:hypothetical protein KUTeg_003426 [Tegillarca granosa]|uniref:Uncharacterized protein n=1 Tax=Tegillarca granosa TaxID=220873 RepID=A0ABQ9FM47_TEGGR|nr:hypothetical protein KUTeg_003426 [Tegillarca granosa]